VVRSILILAPLWLAGCGPSDGPRPIVWNKEACAHCHMLIGDPHFAAQIQTADGAVYDFDDPGCLLLFRASHPEIDVRATWYHHVREDRWIPGERVAFVRSPAPTPMGYGLGAVERGTQTAALDPRAALEAVQRREAARGRP
jgi:copper chaperone NosL